MARMTAKEIGEALDLENQIEHDLLVDESERESWQDYQDGLSCEGNPFYDEDWFDDLYDPHDDYDPYPPYDDYHDDYGWMD